MPTPRCFDAKPKESWGLKPFCPAWPTYALPAEPSSLLSDAVRRALRPFEAGVSAADLDAALAPRCAQRLCMRVQILRGRVYVVAPHAKRCAEFHTPASPCSPYQRQRTPPTPPAAAVRVGSRGRGGQRRRGWRRRRVHVRATRRALPHVPRR